jgi:hypothetical protein
MLSSAFRAEAFAILTDFREHCVRLNLISLIYPKLLPCSGLRNLNLFFGLIKWCVIETYLCVQIRTFHEFVTPSLDGRMVAQSHRSLSPSYRATCIHSEAGGITGPVYRRENLHP